MPFTLRSMSAGIQMLRNGKPMTLVWNATLYIKQANTYYLFHKHELGLLEKNLNFSQTCKKITILGTFIILSIWKMQIIKR